MRILLHSNAPWVKTGYGQQTELLAPRLKAMGHDVAISAFYGLSGTEIDWHGIPVFPSGVRPDAYGIDMIPHYYSKFQADIVVILADAWVGQRHIEALSKLNVANWLPLDADPLSRRDYQYLIGSGAMPIAMSRFGQRTLQDENLPALYAPHGIDTTVFRPWVDASDRELFRAEAGVSPDTFVIGINAANRDLHRKGFFEQMEAFARFHAKVPDSRLYIHTVVSHPNGLDIVGMAKVLGISDAVLHPDQGPMAAGEIDSLSLVKNFYHLLDLYSGCSLAEGFGVPILEAQACGVPVVVTDGSAMTELCASSGWLISGEPYWVEGHQGRWVKPYIADIAAAYQNAYRIWREHDGLQKHSDQAVQFASAYDIDAVVSGYWSGVLGELGRYV